MKPTRILLLLLVIAAGLVAAIVRVKTLAPVHAVAGADGVEGAAQSPVEASPTAPDEGIVAAPNATTARFSWHSVEDGDYRKYVAKLRAIGCPEQTLRDIVIADVTRMFAPREQPLRAMLTNNNATVVSTAQLNDRRKKEFGIRKQLRAVQLERNALLQELIGVQLPVEVLRGVNSRSYAEFEAAFNALPAGKRELVRDIQETYWQDSDALSEKFRGTNTTSNWRTPEYLAEYTKLNQERRATLAKVMSPLEMEDYEMRITDTGIEMRQEFARMQVSEEEYRRIFRARREVESPYGGGNLTTGILEYDANGEPTERAGDRQSKLREEIKSTLGEERYAQYEKSRDYAYQTFSRLGERFSLAPDTIEQAYALQKQANEQRQRVAVADNPQARNTAVRAINTQLEEQMKQLLGERAFKAMRRNYGSFDSFE